MVKSSEIRDIVVVGFVGYLAYHFLIKRGSIGQNIKTAYTIPTKEQIIEANKTNNWEGISPIYKAGYKTGEFLGRAQQNLVVWWHTKGKPEVWF
jgi:hypothetical protein